MSLNHLYTVLTLYMTDYIIVRLELLLNYLNNRNQRVQSNGNYIYVKTNKKTQKKYIIRKFGKYIKSYI